MHEIFVFGSNYAGIHGAGAAKFAVAEHGAKWNYGEGLQGNSYAIPTKDRNIETLPLKIIKRHVDTFLDFASEHQDGMTFKVTAIGCGLAGYKPTDIGPMFIGATDNCLMPPEWKDVVELKDKGFWKYD